MNEKKPRGILIRGSGMSDILQGQKTLLVLLGVLGIASQVEFSAGIDTYGPFLSLWLSDVFASLSSWAYAWAPNYDTLQLNQALNLDTFARPTDLTKEIWFTMLMGPVAFKFPSVDELLSAIRIRQNIVRAARNTSLAFHTSAAERPADCWHYDEDHGFIIRPGVSLITALTKATQPEVSGMLYSFSCYRASEYVTVLGIAQELEQCNPVLYSRLQSLWTRRSIRSGEFHEVFLHEHGSMDQPMPHHYYVPGDRVWFRNPDEASAAASGFEGSWVIYLGDGLFSNFWKHDEPFTLQQKCVEIYHWRNGLYIDQNGDERIDETKVAACVETSLKNPAELEQIMTLMQRYREPRGVYTDAGGCIDTSREFARWVHPTTANMTLPAC